MKTTLIVFILIFILTTGAYARELLKKVDDSDLLEYELRNVNFPLLSGSDLAKIIDGGNIDVQLTVTENLKNPTSSSFEITALNLKLSTSTGETILIQKKPLWKPFVIKPNSENNLLELSFILKSEVLRKLVRDAGGIIKAGINKLQTDEFGFEIRLTGYLETEGFIIDLDETFNL